MFDNYKDVVTVSQLMEMLNIGRNKAYNLLNSGKIKAKKDDTGYWIIVKQSVIDYVSQPKIDSNSPSANITPILQLCPTGDSIEDVAMVA